MPVGKKHFSSISKAGWIFPVLIGVSLAAHAGFFATRLAFAPHLAGEEKPFADVIEVVLVEETPPPEPEPELPPEPEPEPEVEEEIEEMPPEPEPEVLPEPEPVATPQPTPQATPRPVSTPRPQQVKPRPVTPAPRPVANRVVEARPDVSRNAPPRYPESARRAKQEGRVMVRASVSAEGRVQSVRVQRSSGHSVLDRAALDAVRRWRFVPRQVNGQASPGEVDVPVNFFLTAS
jgi:protein TonB